jgi:hypothetical protein
MLTTQHPLSIKFWTNFAYKRRRSVGMVRSQTKATELLVIIIIPNWAIKMVLGSHFILTI